MNYFPLYYNQRMLAELRKEPVNMVTSTHLICTLIDIKVKGCHIRSPDSNSNHVFRVCVFIVRDVDDEMEGMAGIDPLSVLICYLDTIFGK